MSKICAPDDFQHQSRAIFREKMHFVPLNDGTAGRARSKTVDVLYPKSAIIQLIATYFRAYISQDLNDYRFYKPIPTGVKMTGKLDYRRGRVIKFNWF